MQKKFYDLVVVRVLFFSAVFFPLHSQFANVLKEIDAHDVCVSLRNKCIHSIKLHLKPIDVHLSIETNFIAFYTSHLKC